jgi:rhodanese-related sulfurtransferase
MTSTHRVLAILALAAGLLAVFAGSPYLASDVTALELAMWIRDRKPGLRVIDLRDAADFETYHVPGSQRLPATFQPDDTVVLVSERASAGRVRAAMRTMGRRNVYLLRGGIDEWLDNVMNPNGASQEAAALSRYFGGVPRTGRGNRPVSATAMRRRGC